MTLAIAASRLRPRGARSLHDSQAGRLRRRDDRAPRRSPGRRVCGRGIAGQPLPSSAWRCLLRRRSSRGRSRASPILAVEGLRDLALPRLPGGARSAAPSSRRPGASSCVRMRSASRRSSSRSSGSCQHQRLDWWGFRPSIDAAPEVPDPPRRRTCSRPRSSARCSARLYGALDSVSRGESGIGGPTRGLAPADAPSRGCRRSTAPRPSFGHPNVAAEVVAAGFVALVVAARAAWARAGSGLPRGACRRRLSLRAASRWRRWRSTSRSRERAARGSGFSPPRPCSRRPSSSRRRRAGVAPGSRSSSSRLLAAGRRGVLRRPEDRVAARGAGSAGATLDRITALFRKRADPARDTIQERRILWANTHAMLAGAQGRPARPRAARSRPRKLAGRVSAAPSRRCGATCSAPTRSSAIPIIRIRTRSSSSRTTGSIGTALIAVFLGVVIARLASAHAQPARPEPLRRARAPRDPRRGRNRLALLVPAPPRAVSRHRVPRLRSRSRARDDAELRPPSRRSPWPRRGSSSREWRTRRSTRRCDRRRDLALVSAGAMRLRSPRRDGRLRGRRAARPRRVHVLVAAPEARRFDALVAIVGCGVVALAALPLDRSVVWKGAAARALVIAS